MYKGNPNIFEKTFDRNIYVDILKDIADTCNNLEAFQMLLECLDYEIIRNYAFEALKICFHLRPEMFTQTGVSNEKVFIIKDYSDKEWFNFVLPSLLEEGLCYEFESTEMKDKTFLFKRFMLKDSFLGLKEYRERLWNLSFLLNDECKYELIESFSKKCPLNNCCETYICDLKCVSDLIASIGEINILR